MLDVTCSHQRAPLVAMTELPRSSSVQNNPREENTKWANDEIQSGLWRDLLFLWQHLVRVSVHIVVSAQPVKIHFWRWVLEGYVVAIVTIVRIWPECEVAFVVCCDEDWNSNFLSWLITPATRERISRESIPPHLTIIPLAYFPRGACINRLSHFRFSLIKSRL